MLGICDFVAFFRHGWMPKMLCRVLVVRQRERIQGCFFFRFSIQDWKQYLDRFFVARFLKTHGLLIADSHSSLTPIVAELPVGFPISGQHFPTKQISGWQIPG